MPHTAAFAPKLRRPGPTGVLIGVLLALSPALPATSEDGPGWVVSLRAGGGYYGHRFGVDSDLDGAATGAELGVDGPLLGAAVSVVPPWRFGPGLRPFARFDYAIPPVNTEEAGPRAGAPGDARAFGRVRYLDSFGLAAGLEVPLAAGPLPDLVLAPHAGVRIARFRLGNILDETGLGASGQQVLRRDVEDVLGSVGLGLSTPLRDRGRLRPHFFIDFSYLFGGDERRSRNVSAFSTGVNDVRFSNDGGLHAIAGLELRFGGPER